MNPRSREMLARFQPLIALVVMIAGLSLMAGSWHGIREFWHGFLTVENGLTVLKQSCINLCLSLGMTLVILSGGIDLSVGSVLAITGALGAGLLRNGLDVPLVGIHLQFTPFGAMLTGVAAGLALGWVNGLNITRLCVPPFVATLGMLSIARGFTMLYTNGYAINDPGPVFTFVGNEFVLGVPVIVWICAALLAVFYVVSLHTPLGRYVYAIGGSERAAAYAGLNVDRVKVWVYTLAGGLAGVAGLLQTARVNGATPNAGIGFELDSIAAVVIGGTSLSGGRGSVLKTVLGCLIIGVLNSGLVQLGVSPFWQPVVKGVVIVAAVALDRFNRRED